LSMTRVAITRPKERSGDTVRQVEERGWEAVIVPAIEIVPREDIPDVKFADFDWLVLTSASGAAIIYDRFGGGLKDARIAVIGPKTREILEKNGITVDLMPSKYRAEDLAEELLKIGIKGKKILVARASIGREVLVDELKKQASVDEITLYDTIMPDDRGPIRAFEHALKNSKIDAVVFTSSQTVKNLFEMAGDSLKENLRDVKTCAIGPITARTLLEFGVRPDFVPEEYTVKACLDALASLAFLDTREEVIHHD